MKRDKEATCLPEYGLKALFTSRIDFDNEKHLSTFVRTARTRNLTWRGYIKAIIDLGVKEETITVSLRLPISDTEYGNPIDVKAVIRPAKFTMEDGKFIYRDNITGDGNALAGLLEGIMKKSGMRQTSMIHRIMKYLSSQDQSLTMTKLHDKAATFLKRISGDELTWKSFLNALDALRAREVKLTVESDLTNTKGEVKLVDYEEIEEGSQARTV